MFTKCGMRYIMMKWFWFMMFELIIFSVIFSLRFFLPRHSNSTEAALLEGRFTKFEHFLDWIIRLPSSLKTFTIFVIFFYCHYYYHLYLPYDCLCTFKLFHEFFGLTKIQGKHRAWERQPKPTTWVVELIAIVIIIINCLQ